MLKKKTPISYAYEEYNFNPPAPVLEISLSAPFPSEGHGRQAGVKVLWREGILPWLLLAGGCLGRRRFAAQIRPAGPDDTFPKVS